MFNTLAGGRIFPGRHFHARFDVKEGDGNYQVAFKSSDGAFISIDAKKSENFNPDSIFQNFENASRFFEGGAIGYSPNNSKYEGLQLKTFNWKMEPLQVASVQSSFFEDETVFPQGSTQFDNALLMTQIKHEWHSVGYQPFPPTLTPQK
jgi:hypothetical protein